MNKLLLIASFLLMFTASLQAQPDEQKLLEIDGACQQIRDEGFTRIDTLRFECPDRPDFGEVRYFTNGKELRYIEINGGDGSHCDYYNTYYLQDGLPLYVRTTFDCWHFTGGEPDSNGYGPTEESHMAAIYYVSQGKAFYCLDQSYSIPSDSSEFVSPDDFDFLPNDCNFFAEFVYSDLKDLLSIYEQRKKKVECIFDLVPMK